MTRQSFLGDEPWDVVREEMQVRTRVFARQVDDLLSASLYELLPGSVGDRLHMHYGIEEMFFVLSGTPTLRNGQTEEQLAPGTWCVARKDAMGCIRSRIRQVNRRGSSLYRRGASPMSSSIRRRASRG